MSTSKQSTPPNPHARWLRELAAQLERKKDTAGARTCSRAADEIDALVSRLYPGNVDQIERYRRILTRICLRTPPKDASSIRTLCREGLAGSDGETQDFLFDPGTRVELTGSDRFRHARYLCPSVEKGRHVIVTGTDPRTGAPQCFTTNTRSISPYQPRSQGGRTRRAPSQKSSRK